MTISNGSETPPRRKRVFLAGATGYIGKHAARELVRRGHQVVCLARRRAGVGGAATEAVTAKDLAGAEVRFGDVTSRESLLRDGLRGEAFDAVVSCLASRTGGEKDAWLIEHQANLNLLAACRDAGAGHFVLLSAICVQKPLLHFQHAKLAFEEALIDSGLIYSIVRPTAFFKSLSGQVDRVKTRQALRGLWRRRADSLQAHQRRRRGLLTSPIASTIRHSKTASCRSADPAPPSRRRQQGELLFALCRTRPRYQHVPVALLDVIIALLAVLGRLLPTLVDKAEFARIGRYYATESMLVLDSIGQRYSADATPSYGRDTLREFYARVLGEGVAGQELGDQAVFSRSRPRTG